jgi:hypothetical protein
VREAAAWALGRWIECGVMADEALTALASRDAQVSSMSPPGSRPGPSAE